MRMTPKNRRSILAALGFLPAWGLAAAQPASSPADLERELKAVLAENHARFVRERAGEVKALTEIPEAVVPRVSAARVAAAPEERVAVKQRLILMKMQANTLETVRLTLEGLRRLRTADAPGEDQLAAAKAAIPAVHDRILVLEAASGAERGLGMHESVRLVRKGLDRVRQLGDSLKGSKSWGAEEIAGLERDIRQQLEAVAAAVPDLSLIPALKTDGLKDEWSSFNKAQQEGLRRADEALDQSKITADEYESLIAGRRELARMWELYQEAWLKR